jgi:outer membrane protein OmpA-like peptidoglycan-associated protein
MELQTSSATVARTVQRKWIRSDAAASPFVWAGLLPVLGLALVNAYAVLPFARNHIERTVLSETRAKLDAQGMSWAELMVSGQHVIVRGSPPDAGAGEAALATARATTCPTWLGRFTCAVQVIGLFTPALPKPAPKVEPTPAAAPAASAASVEAVTAAASACEKSLAEIVAQTKIEFATASAIIQARSAPVLDALAQAAAQCPGRLLIEGHTDSTGSPTTNQALSLARAEAVRAALARRGLAQDRLQAQGLGDERPLADNGNAEGRARNRRIEFRAIAASN